VFWCIMLTGSIHRPTLLSPSCSPLGYKRRRFEENPSNPTMPLFQTDVDMGGGDDDGSEEINGMLPHATPLFQTDVDMGGGDDDGSEEINGMTMLPHATSFSSAQPSSSMQQICASSDLSARMRQSVDDLEAASQAVRHRITAKEQSDKSTTASYERHINNYVAWWAVYQSSLVNADPSQIPIPAFPVTAAKATMFLEYTSTRPKVMPRSSL
jgi:hypothetical protein